MVTLMRRLIGLFAFLALLLGVSAVTGYPGRLLDEASGSVSQTLCSKIFVSGLDPDDVFADHLAPEPGMWIIAWAISKDIDRAGRQVRTRVFGLFERQAVFREGRGCTLTYQGSAAPEDLVARPHAPALLPGIAGPDPVIASDPAIKAAIDGAFAEPAQDGSPLRTKAVVVVHDGKVIGERYAPGIDVNTPLLSHSIAKSVVNALAGILVRQGRLKMSDPVQIPAWIKAGDERAGVTPENLMRMNAGFGFDEGGGASAATHIWYSVPDMAAEAAKAQLISTPGAQWGYSSSSFVLLSRVIGNHNGGSPQAQRDVAQRELFDPLGMHSVTLEFDATGTMMGANAIYATPRDWAKFGLLYLNDGVISGTRILPEGWVKWSTTPTPGSGYGAGFWLNQADDVIGEWGFRWGIPGAPKDAYMARGYMGQYVIVVPSERLVVVRFGASHGKGAGMDSAGALVSGVIAALRKN